MRVDVRILLFTGKGGVGKTSVAAATALRTAASGLRTLVVSTDPAHSLADALEVPLGSSPAPVAPNLWAEQIDAHERLARRWGEIRGYLVSLLRWGGLDDVEAEELAVLPGLEEIVALVDVAARAGAREWDVLVVDCAPTAETLRLLSLPDALGWYLRRVLPIERQVARVVRPVLGRVTTMPLPADGVLAAVERLGEELERVRRLLCDPLTATVRLVVNPEKIVVAEAMRTFTALCLFGYAVDAVVVNRVLPDDVTDPWFDRWKAAQAQHLRTLREGFATVPLLCAPLFAVEPVGSDALERLAGSIYGERDPAAVLRDGRPLRVRREGSGWLLALTLPGADRDEVDVFARGDELRVKVGAHHRAIALPHALARCEVTGAALRGGVLEVRFAEPEPERGGVVSAAVAT